MNYWELRKSIEQGKFQPVYLVVGEEDYLAEDLVRRLLAATVEPGAEDFNLDILYASEAEPASIINAASAYPMMAQRRAVVVRELQKMSPRGFQMLASYVEKPSPTTCLILVAETLNYSVTAVRSIRDHATYIELKPLFENQAAEWVTHYLGEQSVSISASALRLLQACVGNSLRALVSELEKIRTNIDPRMDIEEEDVANAVGVSRRFSVFELCDAVGRKDIKSAYEILNHMMNAGESATMLVSMLARHFRLLLKTKELIKRGKSGVAVAQALKVNKFFVKGYQQQCSNYSHQEIGRAFELLLDADVKLKSTSQKPRLLLELLVFEIVRGRGVEANLARA